MHPQYLRVVVTPRCTLSCGFCHMEGDPGQGAGASRDLIIDAVHAAHLAGVRKVKFLGGEPLLRADLPDIVRAIRPLDLDISLITGGVGRPGVLSGAFEAGLDRANLSVHGWNQAAFERRTRRTHGAWRIRNHTLNGLLTRGRPLKLNYVYTGPGDEDDLADFLEWAADKPVVVAVLDDLSQSDLDAARLYEVLVALRGVPVGSWTEPDPHSLSTFRMRWADGLVVELKDQQLGRVAPWKACAACPVRAKCREGIHALRLGHDGRLRTCMDRPDLALDLVTLRQSAPSVGLGSTVTRFVREHARRHA